MSNHTCNEIWIVLDSRQFGGIETYVAQLANGLVAHNQACRVLLIEKYTPLSPLCEKLTALGIPYQFLGISSKTALKHLCQLVNRDKPIALHANGYKANLIAKATRLMTGVRLISTYHAGETPKGRMWLYDWLDRTSAFIANHAVVVSQAIGRKIPSSTRYIENFVDSHTIEAKHGEQIAFVGRLSEEKAPDRYLRLAQKFPLHTFHLYGTGDLADKLATHAPQNCQFHGHQNDMSQVWPSISLIVICSHYEGLPMVALEAMARGIIVIATRVGELPQLIVPHQNGYLADDEEQLAVCVQEWLSLSFTQQKLLREHAINTIRSNYSQQSIIPKMLALYSK
ncbi:glycosyltransferase family 4 protein [Vibrio panuliri]|uniref:Glycosyltransferase n=1 Tax=Vibrio panuliri TaxID=1381081 RepID=A0ABX3FG42_9VIBR|nr:glycosyltransferase family 4 protein [Vibrio panuliri]KAB1454328.1 glycosyltransferase family 4 protein [Vibrio panuliri]OLQ89298.1 glycosyltransferase [Vibrio panuliri]